LKTATGNRKVTNMHTFHFEGLHNYPSKCEVQVVPGDPLTIVVTQPNDNMGTSVTNAWPFLADQIEEHFKPQGNVRWIEHYPERGEYRIFPETWEEVHLVKIGGRYEMANDRHPWSPLTEGELAELQSQLG